METLGHYRIIERVGKGAMGVVYRADDPSLGEVAVKIMSEKAGKDSNARERFIREARIAAGLNHDNIVDIHGLGEHDGRPYIVMEFLEGESLKAAIGRRAELSLEQRVQIMKEVADALAYAHRHDIAHRDIKPENIYLTRDGSVRILDFGIARIKGSTMTVTGALIGTPSYMAPEQVKGQKVDRRADVFAAGTVFYELLTGERAFAGRVDDVLDKIINFEPAPVHRLNDLLPLELSSIVHKAMSKDPNMRYQSMDEVLIHLGHFENSLAKLRDKVRRDAEAALQSFDGVVENTMGAARAKATDSLPDGYLELHAVIRHLSDDRDQLDVLIDELQWVSEVASQPLDQYGQSTLRTMANRVDEIRQAWPSEAAAAELGRLLLDELRNRITAPASMISDPSSSSSGSGEWAAQA